MLILNKDKEDLLVSKYGFTKEKAYVGDYYKFRNFVINGANYGDEKSALRIYANNISSYVGDLLYTLIMDKVLIKVDEKSPNEYTLKTKIKELEDKIKELENK